MGRFLEIFTGDFLLTFWEKAHADTLLELDSIFLTHAHQWFHFVRVSQNWDTMNNREGMSGVECLAGMVENCPFEIFTSCEYMVNGI